MRAAPEPADRLDLLTGEPEEEAVWVDVGFRVGGEEGERGDGTISVSAMCFGTGDSSESAFPSLAFRDPIHDAFFQFLIPASRQFPCDHGAINGPDVNFSVDGVHPEGAVFGFETFEEGPEGGSVDEGIGSRLGEDGD